MNTIHKYLLPLGDVTTLTLGKRAIVLDVQAQHGVPVLWVEVLDTRLDSACVERKFITVVTGGSVPEGSRYCGTYQLDHGNFIGHVYELGVYEPDIRVRVL